MSRNFRIAVYLLFLCASLMARPWILLFGTTACDDCAQFKQNWQEEFAEPDDPLLIFINVEDEDNYRFLAEIEKTLLWPARDRKVFVLAYAPYGTASAISPERGVEFEGIDAEAIAEDLLYSDPVPDASKGRDGVIPLTFYPALCRVDFRLRTDAFPVEKVEVKALRALTLVTRGDFQSLPSPKWTLSGNPGPVTLAEGSFLLEGEPTVISGNHPLIPQRISTRFEAEIDYTDTNGIPSHWTVSTEPVEKNFIPGRSYYVDLMFSVETCTLTTL